MDEIKDLLTQWGLPEIYDSFVENNIDVETFHQLNDNDIKELFPAIGTRKKFSQKYQQYLIEKAVLQFDQQATGGDTDDTGSVSTSSTASVLDYDKLKPQYSPSKSAVGQSYEICVEVTQENSVLKLLDASEEGRIIKSTYGPFKKFRRGHLCNLITKNELQNSPDKRITTERFKILSQEINEIFIHEDPSIYYLPYTKGANGKVVAASGKLWSAYVNQRKLLRETGLIQKRGEPSTSASLVSENDDGDEDEDMLEIFTWLLHNSIPYEEVVERWQKSAVSRLKFKGETIEEYYKKYPALSLQTGYLLLELDFIYLHRGKENALFLRWPTLAISIYNMIIKKNDSLTKDFVAQELEKFENVDDYVMQIIALKLLPLLLQSPMIKAKTSKTHWKPSRREMLDGFILFIDDVKNVSKKLEERRLKCQNLKITAQPIPIVVGTYKSYQSFVSVNEQLYKVEDPLKAVDICFKVYHALNANYPQESTPTWLFLQKGIYNIHTSYDQQYRSVDVLIATLKVHDTVSA